jgi:propionyl-CoA carboxylase alpha chain
MISKLVTHASNREQAISAMQQALNEYYIEGVDTNINFLSAILQEPRFQSGEIDTNFIDTHFPEGYSPSDNCPDDLSQIAAIIATLHFRYRDRAAKITNQVPHTQHTARRDWVAITNKDTAQAIDITGEGGDFTVKIAKQDFQIKDTWKIGNPLYSGEVNGKKISLQINRADYRFTVNHQGYTAQFQILTPGTAALASLMPVKTPPDLSKFLLSPMPGLLVSMNPKVGDSFEAGQELAVVEAMKMENSLRAENACTVKAVHAKPGEILEVDALILEFE